MADRLPESWAWFFLRPLRGFLLERFSPRVPLRGTLGYDPAPLRGSRLSTSSSRALSERLTALSEECCT